MSISWNNDVYKKLTYLTQSQDKRTALIFLVSAR